MKKILACVLTLTIMISSVGILPISAANDDISVTEPIPANFLSVGEHTESIPTDYTREQSNSLLPLQVNSGSSLGLTPTIDFKDVLLTAYYTEGVAWAVAKNITNGTSSTTFSPNETCTRAQVVTFLWRAMGQPEPTTTLNPFTDVNNNAYYYKAVMWAFAQGITTGTSNTTFEPEKACTRAQVVTFLWRTMGKPEPTSSSNPFRDVAAPSFYYTPVLWAIEENITYGTSATAFSPNQRCTRGQIVTFLFRAFAEEPYVVELPILLYHNLTNEPSNTVCAAQFAQQMEALQTAGYTPIKIQALEQFVLNGTRLPDKPVLITFDDGYSSNYEIAWPILKKHGFSAVIFVIGCSIGKNTYKETGVSMYSHFTMEQGSEMVKGGLITLASHGYDIHEVKGRDPEPIRKGILQKEGETDKEYEEFLSKDCEKMRNILGSGADYFAYPYGIYSDKSERILLQEGVRITMTTANKTNVLVRGMPQSLLQLGRFSIPNTMSGEALVSLLNQH